MLLEELVLSEACCDKAWPSRARLNRLQGRDPAEVHQSTEHKEGVSRHI
jgi:hypothetical protein